MESFFYNFKIKAVIAGFILIAMGCGTLYWYFGYHIKTPEYALKMIGEAITDHDMNKFDKYVDRKDLLEDLSDNVIESIMHSDQQSADNTDLAMQEYSSIFKTAFVKGFDTALTEYVAHGKWPDGEQSNDGGTGYGDLLENAGIDELAFTGYKILNIDKTAGSAEVQVDAMQNEIEKPFSFKIILMQQDDGHWTVTKIANFSDFLAMLNSERKQYMLLYVNKTDALMNEHEKTFKNIEGQLQSIRGAGSLGSDAVRNDLKHVIDDNMLPHWHMLKEALSAINAPKSAETLQKLRLKICDLYISYYENYAKWLDNKDIKSLREADDSLRKAKILESNETNLRNIIKRDLSR